MHEISDAEIDLLLNELNAAAGPGKQLVLDESRRQAIKEYSDIQACPGSGKTTLIGLKLLILAKKWASPHRGVCVLTHTNVAKAEILDQIKASRYGYNIMRYPHFIGTIQDFVNTFLALPYARSQGWSPQLVDSARYNDVALKALGPKLNTKSLDRAAGKRYCVSYQFGKERVKASDLFLCHEDGHLRVSEKILNDLDRHIDRAGSGIDRDYLLTVRLKLCERGYFLYREMYALAWQAIHENPCVLGAIRERFPIVLFDEMQDTQLFQEELLARIFEGEACQTQRLGDPDQAIFDGIGEERPNVRYNDAVLNPIRLSHRFHGDIAEKICGLSSKKIHPLETSKLVENTDLPSAVILYSDETIGAVLETFADIVAILPPEKRVVVKAVGGVAKEPEENSLTVKSYWNGFARFRTIKRPKPETFAQALRCCADVRTGHAQEHYQLLIASTLELLRLDGKSIPGPSGRNTLFTQRTLALHLIQNGKAEQYRELMAEFLVSPMPSLALWQQQSARLCAILDIEESDATAAYLAYGDVVPDENVEQQTGNLYLAGNGQTIEVGTIHSVKGETHDATLILETKFFRLFDVAEMIPHWLDRNKACSVYDAARPTTNASIRASFMKRLYVAGTRPKHFLCIAMHKDRLDAVSRTGLANARWNIVDISAPVHE